MGNNQVVEAHARSAADKAYDNRDVWIANTIQGDQDGQEIRVTSYYWYSSGGWDGILRYNDGPISLFGFDSPVENQEISDRSFAFQGWVTAEKQINSIT